MLGPNDSGSSSFWVVAGSTATGTSTGTLKFPVTNLGDVILWRCLGTPVEMTFSLTIYLSDNGATALSASLQGAYDEGRTISTSDASGGPVQITRDSPTVSHAALHVRDTNSQPGRTQALLLVDDANDGAGPSVQVTKTATGALGAELRLYQDSSSPAASDVVGRLSFQGEDDGSTQREYARIDGMIYNPAAATPNGRVSIYSRGGSSGGALYETFRTYSDQFGNIIAGTSRMYVSYLYPGGLTFYGDNQVLTMSGGHLVAVDTASIRVVHSGSFAQTSGTTPGWSHTTLVAPTSGSAAFVGCDEALSVNQTGGANGDVTVHRISLTETAVGGTAYLADWRAGAAGTSRRLAMTSAGDLTVRSDTRCVHAEVPAARGRPQRASVRTGAGPGFPLLVR